jgi:16S rRNA (uracil1498-N3)-methyltransferase
MWGKMHYFFLKNEELKAGLTFQLREEDINHAVRVLRLKPGETVALADGIGTVFSGTVSSVEDRAVKVLLREKLDPAESRLKITLVQGLVKGEKNDLIVRQAVELGVSRIQPLYMERSVPHRNKKQEEKRLLRWRAITRSAAAQCRRSLLPVVKEAITLEAYLEQTENLFLLVPWEGEKSVSLNKLQVKSSFLKGAVSVLIGPEGGFGDKEIEILDKAGAVFIHLGPRILRSETAAIVAIALLQSAWGDLA